MNLSTLKDAAKFAATFCLFLFPLTALPQSSKVIKVACVGDSITEGSGTGNAYFESYPSQLQRMLGEKWIVGNFGSSARTLLNSGDFPYQTMGHLTEALKFNPDRVIIMLGTNDTKPQNWKNKDQFVADYKDLIGKFKALNPKPKIFICYPPLVPGVGNYGINESAIQEQIPLIDRIAQEENVRVIDMHAPLVGHEALEPDRVHPNTEGANLLARAVFKALTGNEMTGEMAPGLYGDWQGYKKLDLPVAGRNCLLIFPKNPAPGNPWIWRTEFFGVEPQADLALLAKGYHVAYMDLQNMYGSPASLDLMDQFYDHLVKQNSLAPKVVLEGFSRGGLFALNWAARNPGKVASMYLDAPVCDFKSWPAGKGKGQGSPEDWERLLKAYNLSEEQALAYPLNPVDNLKPLAAAKIPIIMVCGDADKTVPFEENAQMVEQRYKELGGEIQVITKPGGDHHPHSLPDPAPIVDFILKHPAQP